MADTVDLNEIKEYYDDAETLERKCQELAGLLREARHPMAFTGAGLSTSAGVPDYRGEHNGVWTRRAQGRPPPKGIRMEQAVPTYGHMALAQLVDKGTLGMVVSQNVDGLHRRSGIPADRIAELHGNMYKEVCWSCDADVLRTFDVSERVNGSDCRECRKRVPHFCHCTSRSCDNCGATLKDSIIHFGEDLPQGELTKAFRYAERKADFCLVLGSSCRVSPANEVPEIVAGRGTLVIVNLQKTPIDDEATLLIRGKIDQVMERVMTLLGHTDVPAFGESEAAIAEAERLGITPPYEAIARRDRHARRHRHRRHQHRPKSAGRRKKKGKRKRHRSSAMAPNTVIVGNDAAPHDDNHTRWVMYVDGDTSHIADVTFELHPTFSPPQVTVSEPPFEVRRIGWGTFPVDVTIRFVDDSIPPIHTTHTLDFADGGASTRISLPSPSAASSSASSASSSGSSSSSSASSSTR